MTDFIYTTLETIGLAHPLHPPLTHIPMGMVMGCFFFGLMLLVTGNEVYRKSALHCSILGVIFIVPTAIAGILDWQYFYGSTLSNLIVVKFILAALLTALLAYSIKINLDNVPRKKLFIVYVLCLACAAGLGFSGGELVYGG